MTPRTETGASAVEYALIVSAIAAIVVAVVYALGLTTEATFQHSCDRLTSEMSGSCTP